jgi:hypothetical protein
MARPWAFLALALTACGEAETFILLEVPFDPLDGGAVRDVGQPYDRGLIPDSTTPVDGSAFDSGSFDGGTFDSGAFDAGALDTGFEGDRLAWIKAGMIGDWAGTITTPWTGSYQVEITFRADGTYSARSLDPNNTAFYYGSDDDDPNKRYDVFDVWANGHGRGWIDLTFGPSSFVRDELDMIRLSASQNLLRFDVWHVANGRYGPIEAQLNRR